MEWLENIDQTAFWWVNSHNGATLDWIMWSLSAKWSWALVILSIYIFVTLRHDRKNWLWVLIGIVLCFLLADQISNSAIKDGVQRLRPCHALQGVHMFREGRGGLYGFVSSHAANVFAISMFFSLLYSKKKNKAEGRKCNWLPWLLMTWAVLVSYSRPYLGKHYPGDVVCGALLGLGIGASVYFVISKTKSWISSKQLE